MTFLRKTFYTGKDIDGPQPATALMPYESIFEKIRRGRPEVKTITQYAFPTYAEHGAEVNLRFSTLHQLCENIRNIAREPRPTFSISYWAEPDASMHQYGVSSAQARAQFRLLNDEMEALSRADYGHAADRHGELAHGLIDGRFVELTDYPDITECLWMPPMVEMRAAAFYVKPYRRVQFENAFRAHFGADFLLLSREEVLGKRAAGPGNAPSQNRRLYWRLSGLRHGKRLYELHAAGAEENAHGGGTRGADGRRNAGARDAAPAINTEERNMSKTGTLAQIHLHTAETSRCGVGTGAEMARACREAGYDLLVITDHFFNANIGCDSGLPWEDKVEYLFRGYRAARAEGEKIGLTVLKAWETFTAGPEYITLGLDEAFLLANPGRRQGFQGGILRPGARRRRIHHSRPSLPGSALYPQVHPGLLPGGRVGGV